MVVPNTKGRQCPTKRCDQTTFFYFCKSTQPIEQSKKMAAKKKKRWGADKKKLFDRQGGAKIFMDFQIMDFGHFQKKWKICNQSAGGVGRFSKSPKKVPICEGPHRDRF